MPNGHSNIVFIQQECPLGYSYINHKPEINPNEKDIVILIFTLRQQGYSLRGIGKELIKLGVYPRKSKNNFWQASTLQDLLRNTFYCGHVKRNGSIIFNTHDPIIPQPLFEALNGKIQ